MKATVEELPESKVRMTVDVPSGDVKHAIDHAASDLAGSLRIPGFRKGKVPMPVLLARVGKDRLYAEAVESHIGGWFRAALRGTTVRPATAPEYDYELPSSEKEGFQFTATVGVQALPELPDWATLEVASPEPEVPEELIDAELEVLRSTVADLAAADGRPAREGDTVVVDLVSSDGEAQRDYVVELGSQRLLPEIEEGLVGQQAGGEKEIDYRLPDGNGAQITASIKEVYEKVLPPVDDDLARAASEFDTIAELREEIQSRLGGQLEEQLDAQFRTAALDALVAGTELDVAPGSSRPARSSSGTRSSAHSSDVGSAPRSTSSSAAALRSRSSPTSRPRRARRSSARSCSRPRRTSSAWRRPTRTSTH